MSQPHRNHLPNQCDALSKIHSGQLVVAGILFVALAAGTVSVWHQWSQGREAIAYFGSQAAYNIRYAPHVEWEAIAVPNVEESNSADISQVAGLIHFRQALIEDASFEGQVPVEQARPTWQYVVVFRDSRSAPPTRVLFDLKNAWVGLPGKDTALAARPIADGLRHFFNDVRPAATP